MKMSAPSNTEFHPEHHVLEEPTNDFIDVGVAMGVTSGFFIVVSIIAVVISVLIR
jgi:hypothetical protein